MLRALASAGVACLAGLPIALAASMSGVVAARTGGFGEMTCQQCHWENPLNEASGQFALSGIPETYTPGERYLITVTLARPDLRRAGFQLSAREDGINMSAGADAGTFRVTNGSLEIVQGGEKRTTYVQHTEAGTVAPRPGEARWTFEWTAPEMQIPVVFHATGNAANADASPLGDFIYTLSKTAKPE